MKQKKILLLGLLFFFLSLSSYAKNIELTKDGNTNYKIIISADANAEEQQAAFELQYYLKQISGAYFSVEIDTRPLSDYEIIIGYNAHNPIEVARRGAPEKDGFRIYTATNHLIIAGIKKGAMNGVYELLETYLGCRFYTPDALVIPQNKNISLPEIDIMQSPAFTWRETWHRNSQNVSAFTNWNRLQTRDERQKEWGMFVHTFQKLVPETTYFDIHPEWFSEINGKRVRDGQLCLTNEAVYQELLKNLRTKIEQNPQAVVWSVSTNDNYNNCECKNCKAADAKYQSPSGTLIAFVNRVAAEFPNKIISTLAYQYTRKAPVGITPAKNVNIMFCSIECDRSLPVTQNPNEAGFCKDMKDWAALSNNIFMWDYVVQFRNYMDPFPNLHVLQPNLQFFAENNCLMMFEQGSGGNVTEFNDLRTYLLAKYMWNPYCNADSVMNDYLNGYYGAAGKYIRQYIDTMCTALVDSGKRLDIYGYPINAKNSYLRPELIKTYSNLFTQAFRAVANDSVLLNRVKLASMPLDFAIIDLAMHDLTPELSYFTTNTDGKRIVNVKMVERLQDFVDNCNKFDVASLGESVYHPEAYKQNVLHFIEKGLTPNIAFGKPVKISTKWSKQYDVGGEKALTDGKFGVLDYHYNWLGFQGEHLDAVVDLGKECEISTVSIDFLVQPLSWIFLPKQVEFYASKDGKNWKLLNKETVPQPEQLTKYFIQKYETTIAKQKYRYVKVKGVSNLTCPEWHRGWGQPCWIFADEIVVQ